MRQGGDGMNRKLQRVVRRNLSGWLLLLPGVILFAFFVWVPLVQSLVLSLFQTKGIHISVFVGLRNFKDVVTHPDFHAAFVNTFKYTFWSLAIGFLVPVIISVLIMETRRGQAFFRFSTYFPNIVPGLATILMWGFLFRSGPTGVLNILLSKIGVHPIVWISDAKKVIPLIILTMTWKSAGSTALTYMAGLSGINPELYDAAAIDGAGIWGRLIHVTLPQLFKLGSTLLIVQVISVFQILYEPLVLTNGGPNNASISLMQLVWRYAFDRFDYGHANAVAVVVCLILIVLTSLYNLVDRKIQSM